MKYRIEHAHWIDGSGWSYNSTIDEVDTILTVEQLKDGYEDYTGNAGDEIRLIDNGTNETLAVWEA